MKSITAIENPYASPQSADVYESADLLLRATTRMYRGVGWGGIAFYLLACLIMVVAELTEGVLNLGEILGLVTMFALPLAFFVFVLKTAHRLEVEFDRAYRRARWLGILAATVFCPFLTWPGILAVRRLERYRKFVNNEMQTEP